MSFESDLRRMEEITDLLKKEETGLEDSVKLFEEASTLAKKLSKTLKDIQRKVEIVTTENEEELTSRPFEETGETS